MKQLIFSLILLMFLSPVVFAQPATQDELLDYIKNGPKVTPAEWTKPPSADLEKYLEDIANKQNGSQDSNQFRAGESAADYIHRVNIQNKIAETLGYTESVQPDPTVSTTQVPPDNGQTPAPSLSETQKPDINNYMTNPAAPAPTEIKTLNDIVPLSIFEGTPLNKVLNQLFYIGLVAAIILAIVMIIKGGIEYMTVDSITSKESGKKRVQAALGGLVLAFSAILILNTVNPGLTSLNLQFEQLNGITGVNFGGLSNLTRNPDGTYSTPSGQKVTMTANGITVINPDGTTINNAAMDAVTGEFVSGQATNFGYNDSQDNGQGSPLLDPNKGSGVVTNRNDIYGVALPEDVLMRELGIPAGRNWSDWAAARNAGVLVTDGNKSFVVPIVDLGPGKEPQSRGVVIDETKALNTAFGGDGKRNYKIIPNYYSR